ncbi:MAG: hypothetical protein U9Q81_07640 [Pseudomonadota bacterium]|nr:hypothetical protein [Pseudomonadota bacterium]
MRRLIDEGVRLVFLLLAILLPGAGAHAGGSSSCTAAMTSRVDFLLETQGPVVYAGFFALSRTRGTFLDAAGDQAWITHAPEAIPELLSTARKEALRCAIGGLLEGMRNRARDDFLERLRRWLQVLAQFRACEQATSPEETMAAVYYLPATRGFFDTALKGRNLPSSVLPLQVGTTLSSAEHSIITYSLLNRISLMNLREQLTYFRDLYNTLVDALGATAAGKPSSRQPNETHLAALQPENPRCVLKDARFKVSARIRVGQGYVGGDAPIFEPGYKIELISPQGMRGKGVRIVSVNATQQPWGHLLDPQPLELGKTYRVSDCWRGETEFDYWLLAGPGRGRAR